MPLIIRQLAHSEATRLLGASLAHSAGVGATLALYGDLGAGKTTLTRGLLRGLGYAGTVKSPTYALVEEYAFSGFFLYHFDFYRMRDPSEWDDSGLTEYFRSDALCVIEWAEKAGDRLPVIDLSITLSFGDLSDRADEDNDSTRVATLVAHTEKGRLWLSTISR